MFFLQSTSKFKLVLIMKMIPDENVIKCNVINYEIIT